ncbi:hypothetical protein SRABI118_00524 [Massilia sp. Bi118]|uniref:hypothetical protein n=1 Tax=Massilia sp. Bi118 TaxID=2822346 RepID=UPI001D8D4D3A|nr:hypothetical protein [Massilia sp. Bi118]CAH0151401.1 hypothetical protein SRABI118_00524 [Massilia sp. Bi118]
MPKLILTVAVLALLFCLLCGPVLYVALRFRRGGDAAALRPLRYVWMAQLALACVLIFVADSIGFTNPLGMVLAIVCAVSLGGAALFGAWRLVLRLALR